MKIPRFPCRMAAGAAALAMLALALGTAEADPPGAPDRRIRVGDRVPVLSGLERISLGLPDAGQAAPGRRRPETGATIPTAGCTCLVMQARADGLPEFALIRDWLGRARRGEHRLRIIIIVLASPRDTLAQLERGESSPETSPLGDPRVWLVADAGARYQRETGRFALAGVSWQEVMLVDSEGRLAWTGAPSEAGAVLGRLLAGEWDFVGARAAHEEAVAAQRASSRLAADLALLRARREFAAMADCIERRGMHMPGYRMHRGFYLVMAGAGDRGYQVIREEARHPAWDSAVGLLATARRIVADPDVDERDLELACELATRAVCSWGAPWEEASILVGPAAVVQGIRLAHESGVRVDGPADRLGMRPCSRTPRYRGPPLLPGDDGVGVRVETPDER